MRIVNGGIVYRGDQTDKLAAAVDRIEFPDVGAGEVVVPTGAQGTMWLTAPPPIIGHYDKGDVLDYRDSNHNNDAGLDVLQDVGPSKYKIRKR